MGALNRREFARAAGALVLGFCAGGGGRRAWAADAPAPGDGRAHTPSGANDPNGRAPASKPLPPVDAFLRIEATGDVVVVLAHSEMGQGIWTTLPMLVAEELDCDWSSIRVEHAEAAPAYHHTLFGMQGTGGSTTTRSEFDRYRQVGALARALLVEAGARRFGVPADACRTQRGVVIAGDARATYGELAAVAATLPRPATVSLKPRRQWTLLGRDVPRLDSRTKVDGSATFGLDVSLPGLLTAVVARAPVFGARVRSFDATAALGIRGVRRVVQVPSGVAVVATDLWSATRGRAALRIEWDATDAVNVSSASIRRDYERLAAAPGTVAADVGEVDRALEGAVSTYAADFAVPHLAHAPMEPLNCTVRISPDACEIWTGTQMQTFDQREAAKILGLAPEQVTLHTPFLGGGFGRRAAADSHYVREAVHVAKAVGAPVKTVWTREDDIRGGYYRPAFVHRVRAGLDAAGAIVAWHHRLVGQSVSAGTPMEGAGVRNGIDRNSVEGVVDSPYLAAVPDRRVELHSPRLHVPVTAWRSVGHSHTAFVVESVVDELAARARLDPLEFRRRALAASPRHRAVLERVAAAADWGRPLPSGRARGIAVHASFGSIAAQVAEVSVDRGRVRVHRVVCAVDCGLAVNPAGVRAQMESGIAFGLGAALHGRLTLEHGAVRESNFHDYRVLSIDEMPEIEVHIVESDGPMGGAGEVAVPCVAPAVANALAALTGVRPRELPLSPV